MTKEEVLKKLEKLGQWKIRKQYLLCRIAELESEKIKLKGHGDLAKHLAKIESEQEIIGKEMEKKAIEFNEITAALEVIPEHMGKLLKMRYIEKRQWLDIAMKIGYEDSYVRKQLRDKSLQAVMDLIEGW